MSNGTVEIVTVSVSNSDELASKIKELSANGGGTIRVTASDTPYDLSGSFGTDGAAVRIISDDPDDPALFSRIDLDGAQNLSFEGLLFDTAVSSPGTQVRSLSVKNSDSIAFHNCTFASEADGFIDDVADVQYGSTLGKVRETTNFVFENNDVSGYFHGLALNNVTDTVIADNSFTKMQGDGLRMTGVVDTLIEGNTFADFYGSIHSINHDDMIQLWSTANSQVSENLTIRGNILDSGSGSATQSIFIRNEMYESGGAAYQNIVIEENLIYNGHSHGITVDGTEGVTIANNTLLWNSQAAMQSSASSDPVSSAPKINVKDSTGVTITSNITSCLCLTNVDDETMDNNLSLAYGNIYHENAVETHVVNIANGGKVSLLDMAIRPDSPLAGVAGASLSVFPEAVSDLTPLVNQSEAIGLFQTVIYDASMSIASTGFLGKDGATYRWEFADGTVQTGVLVTHEYEDFGAHDVVLTVTAASGEQATATFTSHVKSDTLLSFDFDNGVIDGSTYASEIVVTEATTDLQRLSIETQGFCLDQTSSVKIEETNAHLQALESFSLAISLACDNALNAEGTILAQHGGLHVAIEDGGAVLLELTTDAGHFSLLTHDSIIGDADWHRLVVTYDSAAETLALHYDGRVIASTQANGLFNLDAVQPLYLGGPSWVTSTTGMVDDLVMTRSVWTENEVKADYAEISAHLFDSGKKATELTVSADLQLHDIDFTSPDYAVESYTPGWRGADPGNVTISKDGTLATLTDNAWKVIDLEISITEDLMLSFEFEAAALGEIHGIGFVSIDGSIDKHAVFQLAGTQEWGLQDDAWSYDIGSGAVHYDIAVGKNLVGSYTGLALVMDDDAGLGGVSSFANIELWREASPAPELRAVAAGMAETLLHDVDFNAPATLPHTYEGKYAQDFGTMTISADGSTATLVENTWKVIDLDVDINTGTHLRFSFDASVEGEIHAIGFVDDTGNVVAEDVFQLAGTQDWGIQDDAWAYEIGSGEAQYEIAIGHHISGDYAGIVLIMDDDALVGADSSFANIEVTQTMVDEFIHHDVDFSDPATLLHTYEGRSAQDFGTVTISADGSTATLVENAWKVVDLDVDINTGTHLRFSFDASVEGEIHAIGFVDDTGNVAAGSAFQLAGTQDWGIQDDAWAYEIGSGEAQYEIAIGDHISGDYAGIALIMDDDALVGADSSFANIEIFC